MKKIFLVLMLISSLSFSQDFEFGEARGLFFSVGVGPKAPIGDFSATNDIGIGFDFTASYADNQIVPVFFYTKIGYQTYESTGDLYCLFYEKGINILKNNGWKLLKVFTAYLLSLYSFIND